MNPNLRCEDYGAVVFTEGSAPVFARQLIPNIPVRIASGPYGLIALQEQKAPQYTLRHFLFRLHKSLTLFSLEQNEGVQTVLALKGKMQPSLPGGDAVEVNEKEYTLLNAADKELRAVVEGSRMCSMLNVYYHPNNYKSFLPLFPAFQSFVKRTSSHLKTFIFPPRIARFSVQDAVTAIWREQHLDVVAQVHIGLHLRTSLFTLLAQTYAPTNRHRLTQQEREKALAARDLILQDISTHLSTEEVAATLHCSTGLLKRAFSKMFGTGLLHFLRKVRMEKAREMLLQGASLKAVALEVGMRPKNFPKEFKSFYGYTVTQLKKGL